MKWLNLHHLKYFFVIVEEGTLTKAARRLLVGQPALSAQLKLFQQALGASLFIRQGKKLVLTPVGEYVYKYAKAIKGLEDELLSNLDHVTNYEERELVLGAQESVPKSVLARAIMTIQKTRPVFIRVIEGTGDELFNLLTVGKIDIFIGNFRPLSTTKEVLYKSLSKEEVYVWGSKSKSNFQKNFPRSLNGGDFILSGLQNQLRHDFEKYMLESGMKFHVSVEAQDTALQKELAMGGLGLLLLGQDSAKAWVKSGRLVKIGKLPGIVEEYWLGIVKKDLDNQFITELMAAF
ncbi:MAG: LysR family transcriptional regulator [Bacteriovoracaceae bacterium]|nr:LysR family transcriptional regulator [Bacteriovoracaceae bacterium]